MIFKIDNKFIYLNNRTFGFLEHIVLDGKNRHQFAEKTFGPNHSWLDVYDEVLENIYELIQHYLEDQAKKNFAKFWMDYGMFKYQGVEAQENSAGILYSYGMITKLINFVPMSKTLASRVFDNQMNGSKLYTPIAKEFYIQYDTRRKNLISKIFNNKWDSFLEINSQNVKQITGELKNFSITLDNYMLFCSDRMVIKK